jgi:hypothetical protein
MVTHFTATGVSIHDVANVALWAREWVTDVVMSRVITQDDPLMQAMMGQPSSSSQTTASQNHQQSADDIQLQYGEVDRGSSTTNNFSEGGNSINEAVRMDGSQNQSSPPLQPPILSTQLPASEVSNIALANPQPMPVFPLSFGNVGPLLSDQNQVAQQQQNPRPGPESGEDRMDST